MSNWPLPAGMDPDDEFRAADALLDKADALLRRHKGTDPQRAEEFVALDDDDLPLLTEVVDPAEFSSEFSPRSPEPSRAPAPGPELPGLVTERLAEQLVGLDTEVSREVEAWFAKEFPQLLSRELDKLSTRLQEEALAHLRATLLPALSERISRSLFAAPAGPHGAAGTDPRGGPAAS
jgi:hypothetical protein